MIKLFMDKYAEITQITNDWQSYHSLIMVQYTLSRYSAIASTDTTIPAIALVVGLISTIFKFAGSFSLKLYRYSFISAIFCFNPRKSLYESGQLTSEYFRE